MTTMNKRVNRLVALIVVFTFFVTNTAIAVPQVQVLANEPNRPTTISIPQELGSIDETGRGRPDKTIIYLQDAHDSLEAQENIAKTIDLLVGDHGVKTVLEEGYEGEVPTDELFGFMKDKEVRQKVSHFLLDKLRISGAEYAHINRKHDFKLIGADSIALHKENVAWYRETAKLKEETKEDLDELGSGVRKLIDKYFERELKAWLKDRTRFQKKESSLIDYLKRSRDILLKKASIQELELMFPNIYVVLEIEKSKDQAAIEKIKTIEARNLFHELEALEKKIAGYYLKEERDQKIFQYHRAIELLRRLNEVEVTPAEYEEVKGCLEGLSTQELADFLAKYTKKTIVLSARWESNIKNATKFYELSKARDQEIAKRLDQFLKSKKEKVAVLVYGGFHKDPIKEILTSKNLSYLIVSPKITEIDQIHQDYYKRLMSMEHLPYEMPVALARASRAISMFVEASGAKSERGEVRAYLEQLADYFSHSRAETRSEGLEALSAKDQARLIGRERAVLHEKAMGLEQRVWQQRLHLGPKFFERVRAGYRGKVLKSEQMRRELKQEARAGATMFLAGLISMTSMFGPAVRQAPSATPTAQVTSAQEDAVVQPVPALPISERLFASSSPNDVASASRIDNGIRISVGGGYFAYSVGGGFSYDDPSTPEVETMNLSGMGQIVLELRGNTPAGVNFTIEDIEGYRTTIRLDNANQIHILSKDLFPSIDLNRAKTVSFGWSGYNVANTWLEVRTVSAGPAVVISPSRDNVTVVSQKGMFQVGYDPADFGGLPPIDTAQLYEANGHSVLLVDLVKYGIDVYRLGVDQEPLTRRPLAGIALNGATIDGNRFKMRVLLPTQKSSRTYYIDLEQGKIVGRHTERLPVIYPDRSKTLEDVTALPYLLTPNGDIQTWRFARPGSPTTVTLTEDGTILVNAARKDEGVGLVLGTAQHPFNLKEFLGGQPLVVAVKGQKAVRIELASVDSLGREQKAQGIPTKKVVKGDYTIYTIPLEAFENQGRTDDTGIDSTRVIFIGYVNVSKTNVFEILPKVPLPVPAGWTRTDHYPYAAYQIASPFNDDGNYYLYAVLLKSLLTGQDQVIDRRLDARAGVYTGVIDVSPNGHYIIYEVMEVHEGQRWVEIRDLADLGSLSRSSVVWRGNITKIEFGAEGVNIRVDDQGAIFVPYPSRSEARLPSSEARSKAVEKARKAIMSFLAAAMVALPSTHPLSTSAEVQTSIPTVTQTQTAETAPAYDAELIQQYEARLAQLKSYFGTTQIDTQAFLNQVYDDTLQYFLDPEAMNLEHGLPRTAFDANNLRDFQWSNPTEWGYYLDILRSAVELGRLSESEFLQKVQTTLNTLDGLQHDSTQNYNGLFYAFYYVKDYDTGTINIAPAHDDNLDIPSIDNALLTQSLIALKEYAREKGYSTIQTMADQIARRMNYSIFLDPQTGLFAHTKHAVTGEFGKYPDEDRIKYWDLYANETHVMVLVAIANGSVPANTLADLLGSIGARGGFLGGSYADSQGFTITAAPLNWDGSLFTYFLQDGPLHQQRFAEISAIPSTLGQLTYAQTKGLQLFGFSDKMSTREGEAGAPPSVRETDWNGLPAPPDIAPYALFLPLNLYGNPDSPYSKVIADLIEISLSKAWALSQTSHYSNQAGRFGFNSAVPLQGDSFARFGALDLSYTLRSIANALARMNGINDTSYYFLKDALVLQTLNQMDEYLVNLFPQIFNPSDTLTRANLTPFYTQATLSTAQTVAINPVPGQTTSTITIDAAREQPGFTIFVNTDIVGFAGGGFTVSPPDLTNQRSFNISIKPRSGQLSGWVAIEVTDQNGDRATYGHVNYAAGKVISLPVSLLEQRRVDVDGKQNLTILALAKGAGQVGEIDLDVVPGEHHEVFQRGKSTVEIISYPDGTKAGVVRQVDGTLQRVYEDVVQVSKGEKIPRGLRLIIRTADGRVFYGRLVQVISRSGTLKLIGTAVFNDVEGDTWTVQGKTAVEEGFFGKRHYTKVKLISPNARRIPREPLIGTYADPYGQTWHIHGQFASVEPPASAIRPATNENFYFYNKPTSIGWWQGSHPGTYDGVAVHIVHIETGVDKNFYTTFSVNEERYIFPDITSDNRFAVVGYDSTVDYEPIGRYSRIFVKDLANEQSPLRAIFTGEAFTNLRLIPGTHIAEVTLRSSGEIKQYDLGTEQEIPRSEVRAVVGQPVAKLSAKEYQDVTPSLYQMFKEQKKRLTEERHRAREIKQAQQEVRAGANMFLAGLMVVASLFGPTVRRAPSATIEQSQVGNVISENGITITGFKDQYQAGESVQLGIDISQLPDGYYTSTARLVGPAGEVDLSPYVLLAGHDTFSWPIPQGFPRGDYELTLIAESTTPGAGLVMVTLRFSIQSDVVFQNGITITGIKNSYQVGDVVGLGINISQLPLGYYTSTATLVGPAGEVNLSPYALLAGHTGFAWQIPQDTPLGVYTLTITAESNSGAPAKRVTVTFSIEFPAPILDFYGGSLPEGATVTDIQPIVNKKGAIVGSEVTVNLEAEGFNQILTIIKDQVRQVETFDLEGNLISVSKLYYRNDGMLRFIVRRNTEGKRGKLLSVIHVNKEGVVKIMIKGRHPHFKLNLQSPFTLIQVAEAVEKGLWTPVPNFSSLVYQIGEDGVTRVLDLTTGVVTDKPFSQNFSTGDASRTGFRFAVTPEGLRELYWDFQGNNEAVFVYNPATNVGNSHGLAPSIRKESAAVSDDGQYLAVGHQLVQISVIELSGLQRQSQIALPLTDDGLLQYAQTIEFETPQRTIVTTTKGFTYNLDIADDLTLTLTSRAEVRSAPIEPSLRQKEVRQARQEGVEHVQVHVDAVQVETVAIKKDLTHKIVSALYNLTKPALVLIDAQTLTGFSPDERRELIALAWRNRDNKKINFVFYNTLNVSSEVLAAYRLDGNGHVGNITEVADGINVAVNQFSQSFLLAYPDRQVIHISKRDSNPHQELVDRPEVEKRIDFYRYDVLGTIAAALLRNEHDGNLRGVVQSKDGFWTVVGEWISRVIQSYLADIRISVAA